MEAEKGKVSVIVYNSSSINTLDLKKFIERVVEFLLIETELKHLRYPCYDVFFPMTYTQLSPRACPLYIDTRTTRKNYVDFIQFQPSPVVGAWTELYQRGGRILTGTRIVDIADAFDIFVRCNDKVQNNQLISSVETITMAAHWTENKDTQGNFSTGYRCPFNDFLQEVLFNDFYFNLQTSIDSKPYYNRSLFDRFLSWSDDVYPGDRCYLRYEPKRNKRSNSQTELLASIQSWRKLMHKLCELDFATNRCLLTTSYVRRWNTPDEHLKRKDVSEEVGQTAALLQTEMIKLTKQMRLQYDKMSEDLRQCILDNFNALQLENADKCFTIEAERKIEF